MRATTKEQLAGAMYDRYLKVNLQSLQRHGTIEFRQHSGTVNAAKVSSWVRFLGGFIDTTIARSGAPAAEFMPEAKGVTARVMALLQKKGEVTMQAMMEHFGWLAHTGRSVISRMRKQGFPIEATKIDGKLAYRLNCQNAPDSLWAGISSDVAGFYQRRAKVLALAA